MKRTVTDQMGRSVEVSNLPKRIVSLVPSQTELLHDLGLGDRVIGITKFCIHPEEWFRSKERVGGTKKLNLDRIRALNPDLIIGNKEENSQKDIEKLQSEFPVWMSDIFNLNDSINMIRQIGELINSEKEALRLCSEIKKAFDSLPTSYDIKPSVLYLIWKKPMIAAGKHTFINAMLEKAGFTNCIVDEDGRYPEVDSQLNPDIVFLSSEPYPFGERDLHEIQENYPHSKLILVDGEIFSWYGSRLRFAPTYFSNLRRTVEL
jgi:ABC-type Fe3+-hydroxamate transport system substrate-binding protein